MVEAIEKAGVVGMTNFSYRWVPSFRLARNLVREGEFGKITRLHIKYLQSWLKDENAAITWRNQKELAGFGALGDLGSHMIDAACFITGGTPERVVGVHHIHVPEKMDPKTGKKTPVTTDTDSQFMVDFGSFVGIFETSQVEPAHGNHLVVSFGGEKGTCRVYSEDGGNIEVAVGTPYASHPTWATHVPKIPIPTSIPSSPGVDSGFYRGHSRRAEGLSFLPRWGDSPGSAGSDFSNRPSPTSGRKRDSIISFFPFRVQALAVLARST